MADEVTTLFQLSPENVTVIGNGIDPAAWTIEHDTAETAKPELSSTGTDTAAWPLLVFAGRLVHEKGLQELIKALPVLRHDHP